MIPLCEPNLSGNESTYLQNCIESNFVSSVGPYVTRFEEKLATLTGATRSVAVASGTSALHLALMAVGVKQDELVIAPSYTFIATANAIAYCGALPWLFDVDLKSLTLDVELLRETLQLETEEKADGLYHISTGKRVAAILPVYTFGMPAEMKELRGIANELSLPIVVDGAASLGAVYHDYNLAELADLTVFSFNGNKTVTTGSGGAIVGCDNTLLEQVHHLSTQARVGENYDYDQIGYNYRMSNIQAALGCAQLERLSEFITIKRKIQDRYNRLLCGYDGLDPFPQKNGVTSACWYSGVLVDTHRFGSISGICEKLRDKDINARLFWKPVHLQIPYKDALMAEFPNTGSFWERVLMLPCSTNLTDEDQSYVVDSLKKILDLQIV